MKDTDYIPHYHCMVHGAGVLFHCEEGGLLSQRTAILLWLYSENKEADKTFFEKLLNSFVVPNITANNKWAIGYYVQSDWGFAFLILRSNWFSGLPLLKGSVQFPPSPGHIFLLFPWCWLLCLSDPTISQSHSLNQRILIHQKKWIVLCDLVGAEPPFTGLTQVL